MLTSDNILKQWKFGIAEGVINKKGLYDNSLFKDIMSEVFKDFKGFGRKLEILLTDADKGIPVYTNESTEFSQYPSILTASISKGGELPFIKIGNTNYMSGSLVQSVSLIKSIERCIVEKGVNEEDVVIDIISAAPGKNIYKDLREAKTLEMAARYFELCSYHKTAYALLSAKQSYPNAQFRFMIEPSSRLSKDSMSSKFSAIDMMKLYQQGYTDAMAANVTNSEDWLVSQLI